LWVAAVGDGLIIAAPAADNRTDAVTPLAWFDFSFYEELLVNWPNT